MYNILLISEYFAPISSIASVRFTKILKYLSRTKKYKFFVIASKNGYLEDDVLCNDLKEMEEYINVKYVDIMDNIVDNIRKGYKYSKFSSEIPVNSSNNVIKFKPYKQANAKEKIYKIFNSAKYIYNESVFVRHGYKVIKNYNIAFDCVISSYGDAGSHLLALKYLSKNPKTPWIADFRDPALTYYRPPLFNPYFHRINKCAIKKAVFITGVTDSALGECEGYKKSIVLFNGFDREDIIYIGDMPEKVRNQTLHICYTGRIYAGKSDAGYLFKAIVKLIEENKMAVNDICIDYAGTNFDLLQIQAKHYGLETILINHGFIQRKQVLHLQRNSDLLLVLSWNDEEEKNVLTGKFMEYLMSGKNILAIVNGNKLDSDISKIIDLTHTGFCFEEAKGDEAFNQLCVYLQDAINMWKNNKYLKYAGKIDKIDRFSYKSISHKFEVLIDKAISRGD